MCPTPRHSNKFVPFQIRLCKILFNIITTPTPPSSIYIFTLRNHSIYSPLPSHARFISDLISPLSVMSRVTPLLSSLPTAVSIPEVKKPQREAHGSLPSSVKIQKAPSVLSISSSCCVPRTTIYVTVEKLRCCWFFPERLLFYAPITIYVD